jgi:hypothetical protein
VVDQQFEPLGQHLRRNAEFALQRVEAVHAARNVPHDQQGPPVTDHFERLRDGALAIGKISSPHPNTSLACPK